VTGVLYEPNDPVELAGALRRMQDPALRDRLSAAARLEVQRYEPGVVAAELQRLYAAVASGRDGRR
jgi:glycosyltransferase involved in cell wall biosynthesis